MNLETLKSPIAALSRMNVVRVLQIIAVAMLAIQFLAAIYPMIMTFIRAPFGFGLFLMNLFSFLVRLSSGVFSGLVLIALAEMIKLKK